jgi:hypothetical protein
MFAGDKTDQNPNEFFGHHKKLYLGEQMINSNSISQYREKQINEYINCLAGNKKTPEIVDHEEIIISNPITNNCKVVTIQLIQSCFEESKKRIRISEKNKNYTFSLGSNCPDSILCTIPKDVIYLILKIKNDTEDNMSFVDFNKDNIVNHYYSMKLCTIELSDAMNIADISDNNGHELKRLIKAFNKFLDRQEMVTANSQNAPWLPI